MNSTETSIDEWLDRCEAELVHPGRVADRLRRSGWAAMPAAAVAEQYRKRFNEHALGYSSLLVTTGVSALALGTTGHTLVAGLNRPVNRNSLAFWLSVFLCLVPFAAWAHQWAAKVDREDPVAVWSRPRRSLALVLLWSCGVVGGLRLLIYATQLIGAVVGAHWAHHTSLLAGFINVAIAISIALPLGLWAYRFLHRFDAEDPTAAPSQRRRQP